MTARILSLVVMSLVLASTTTFADFGTKKHEGKWDKRHPRQAEVNGRLQNQENRVKEGEKDGELTKKEGNQINREDRAIYREEQRMKRRNGGNYLTPEQQARLNKQENRVSNQINRDEKKNEVAAPGGAPNEPAPVAPAPAPVTN